MVPVAKERFEKVVRFSSVRRPARTIDCRAPPCSWGHSATVCTNPNEGESPRESTTSYEKLREPKFERCTRFGRAANRRFHPVWCAPVTCGLPIEDKQNNFPLPRLQRRSASLCRLARVREKTLTF